MKTARETTRAESAPRRHPRRPGTSATELTLVLPVVVLIALVCVDLGRFAYSAIALSNATRAAAQYGATHRRTDYTRRWWEAAVRETLLEEMANLPHFDEARLTLSVEAVDQPGDLPRIDVRAGYPFETVVPWPGLPRRLDLERSVSMRQYR